MNNPTVIHLKDKSIAKMSLGQTQSESNRTLGAKKLIARDVPFNRFQTFYHITTTGTIKQEFH